MALEQAGQGVLQECWNLDLSNNGIAAAGAGSFAGVLAQCQVLAHLNLRGNNIGAGGAEKLAGVLPQCPALTHLNLGGNFIGAESFAGVLAHRPVSIALLAC